MMVRRLAAPLTLALALALAVAVLMSAGNRASGQVGDAVLVGAGDIAACNSSGDEATAALIDDIPGTVAAFGDNAYENGSIADYNDCYEPLLGALQGAHHA